MKVIADVSCQLTVRGMVCALYSHDARVERGFVLLHVSQKVQLGHCRANQQDLLAACELSGDVAKEPGLVIGVIVDSSLLVLGMTVYVTVRRLHRRLVEGSLRDVKDFCLILVNPHRQLIHQEGLAWKV